ncbi:polar amino acid transport system substrate-binding protein [Sporobacter termitidis DSM 10068]|uniref:Polar amino acid transport system substrate-binding protein n=1 Tax=Sporobacter termitidis DSM 10068 TaxID=1123282 RepID=A0A1M5Y5D0_9FIRM|nr:ABC transporter substrate-binding protein [Sporobacter termitidis]SHI07028.1 polar amino acid transport system substrate-binding protein [Sporobacter termitidis DSM 10068]
MKRGITMKNTRLRKWTALCLSCTLLLLTVLAGCASAPTAGSSPSASPSTAASPSASPADAASPSASAKDESALLKKIKEKGYILIGSSNDAPFSYQDVDTGKLAGVDIDILREICSRLGIPDIQMKVIDFSNLLVELNNNSIDMVVDAMYVKDERLQIAAFTDKWYQEGEAVVIPADSKITSKEELAGKTVGAQPGTTFYETAQKWLDEGKIGKLEAYDNQATLMTAVNMGKVDAVITDGIVAGYTLASDSSLKLKLLSPYQAEASGQIGAAVRFTDKDFLAEVNDTLNAMKKDGTLMSILQQYNLTQDYFVDVDEGVTKNVK